MRECLTIGIKKRGSSLSTKYTLRHTKKGSVEKVVSPKARRATDHGDCEACYGKIEPGEWILDVSEGDYSYYIHETCPEQPTEKENDVES